MKLTISYRPGVGQVTGDGIQVLWTGLSYSGKRVEPAGVEPATVRVIIW